MSSVLSVPGISIEPRYYWLVQQIKLRHGCYVPDSTWIRRKPQAILSQNRACHSRCFVSHWNMLKLSISLSLHFNSLCLLPFPFFRIISIILIDPIIRSSHHPIIRSGLIFDPISVQPRRTKRLLLFFLLNFSFLQFISEFENRPRYRLPLSRGFAWRIEEITCKAKYLTLKHRYSSSFTYSYSNVSSCNHNSASNAIPIAYPCAPISFLITFLS